MRKNQSWWGLKHNLIMKNWKLSFVSDITILTINKSERSHGEGWGWKKKVALGRSEMRTSEHLSEGTLTDIRKKKEQVSVVKMGHSSALSWKGALNTDEKGALMRMERAFVEGKGVSVKLL